MQERVHAYEHGQFMSLRKVIITLCFNYPNGCLGCSRARLCSARALQGPHLPQREPALWTSVVASFP